MRNADSTGTGAVGVESSDQAEHGEPVALDRPVERPGGGAGAGDAAAGTRQRRGAVAVDAGRRGR